MAGAFLAGNAADHDGGVHGHPTPSVGEARALQYERRADPAGSDNHCFRFDLEPVALAGAAYAAGLATLYDEIIDAGFRQQVGTGGDGFVDPLGGIPLRPAAATEHAAGTALEVRAARRAHELRLRLPLVAEGDGRFR